MIRRWLALVLLAVLASCATIAPPEQPAATSRTIAPLTEGWGFAFSDEWSRADAEAAKPDAWQQVTLSHSWNRLGEYRTSQPRLVQPGL